MLRAALKINTKHLPPMLLKVSQASSKTHGIFTVEEIGYIFTNWINGIVWIMSMYASSIYSTNIY